MADMIPQPTGSSTLQGTAQAAPELRPESSKPLSLRPESMRPESMKPPSHWDDDSPLLGGIPRPLFQFRLAPIAFVRFITTGLAIANFVFLVRPIYHQQGPAVPGALFTMLLILWNSIAIVYGGLPRAIGRKGPAKLSIGPFTCIFERKSVASHRMPIAVMLTDFAFALLTLVPLGMGAANPNVGWDRVWKNSFAHFITGFSAGVFVLQLALTFLNSLAVCRRAKVCVYNGDEERPVMHRIQLPRD